MKNWREIFFKDFRSYKPKTTKHYSNKVNMPFIESFRSFVWLLNKVLFPYKPYCFYFSNNAHSVSCRSPAVVIIANVVE